MDDALAVDDDAGREAKHPVLLHDLIAGVHQNRVGEIMLIAELPGLRGLLGQRGVFARVDAQDDYPTVPVFLPDLFL